MPENRILLKTCIAVSFWMVIYIFGRHPDLPWGDGLGYAMAVEKGFDLATNANSHYLYLNFHHLIFHALPNPDAVQLLGWASLVWAGICLFLTGWIASVWSDFKASLVSITILASCFPFWRHACIPEVYTMELSFWAALFLCFFYWINLGKRQAISLFFLIHALALLVHIHFILVFPVLALVLIKRRNWSPWFLLWYLIPLLVIGYSVFFLEINTISQVFFDSIQEKMMDFDWITKLKGPFFSAFILIFMFPAGFLLFLLNLKSNRHKLQQIVKEPFSIFLGLMAIPVLGFASLFPEQGIYVFLLPVFLILSLFSGRIFSGFTWSAHLIWIIPIFQIGYFYLGKYTFIHTSSAEKISQQDIKGGSGFLFLPWANGNIASVLQKTKEIPIDSCPDEERWNAEQAIRWNQLHPRSQFLKPD